MKKIIIPFIAIILFAFTKDSDSGILFKVQYSPNTQYAEDIKTSSKLIINYSGSAQFMARLKDKGIKSPMKKNTKSEMQCLFKTGALSSDGKHFPVTLNFTSCKSSNAATAILAGTRMYGIVEKDSVPVLDSIYSPQMSEETRQTLLKTMQSMFSQLTFPEKQLSVGDTFSHITPMSIPMAGSSLNMAINTTYKLMRIKNGIAYFDIAQVYTMKSSQYTMTGSGSGTGKIEYDISRHFYRYYSEDCGFTCKMQIGEISMDLSSSSSYIQKNTFENAE